MPMLDAKDPAFSARYPTGARVFDRNGREIPSVVSADHLTGEVIRYEFHGCSGPWYRPFQLLQRLQRLAGLYGLYGLVYRHGFFPAPLQVVPNHLVSSTTPFHVNCRSSHIHQTDILTEWLLQP